ncbi:MAG: glutamine--fructose-6-phosphate transaminase (isomerizing), partial [Bdellovibrionota bacterium]
HPEHGVILASDAQPILDYTNQMHFLENGDMVICSKGGIRFIDATTGAPIDRAETKLDWAADRLDKAGFPHYMLKEIHEQARTLRDTAAAHLDETSRQPFEFRDHGGLDILTKSDRLTIVACGTSWHASLVGKYWLERWAGLSTDVELASEFRYRKPVIGAHQTILGVSQSGETADTLAVIQDVKKRAVPTMVVTNVKGSTLSREANHTFFTQAGPEIGVASTKAFTAQLQILMMIAGRLGRSHAQKTGDETLATEIAETFRQIPEIPHHLSSGLLDGSPTARAIHRAAEETLGSKGFFFIGRGLSFPLALEGALKLKEIAYVHAEGYAAGELKHGPIAMLEPAFTVIVIAPRDAWYEKSVSNLQEVKARGARTIVIGHADDEKLRSMCDFFIPMPVGEGQVAEALSPFLISPILQLFAYEMAVLKGTDVDQPRNLAKSVTVE